MSRLRFENGWVKTYRSSYYSDIYDNPYLISIWESLLKIATRFETKIIWRGKQKVLVPGSVVFGVKEFADKWDVSRKTIRKWIHYLHDTNRIVLETGPRGCIATICNWEKYQINEDEEVPLSPQSVPAESPLSPRSVTLNGEVREYKNIRKESAKKVSRKVEGTQEFLAEYYELMKKKYGQYPPRQGKHAGIAKRVVKDLGLERAIELITIFVNSPEKAYKNSKHDLGTFSQNLNVVGLARPLQLHNLPKVSDILQEQTDSRQGPLDPKIKSMLDDIRKGKKINSDGSAS